MSSDGSIMAIGAPGVVDYEDRGCVRVYIWNGSVWNQLGDDIYSFSPGGDIYSNDNPRDDAFGTSVSLSNDGTVLAVGASYRNNQMGAVYTYQGNGSEWVGIHHVLYGAAIDNQYGESISLNGEGTLLAIGGAFNDGFGVTQRGHVTIHELQDNGSWYGAPILYGSGEGDNFGASVSMSDDGTRLVVGAPAFTDSVVYDDYGNIISGLTGYVRVFERNGSSKDSPWIQIGSDFIGQGEEGRCGDCVSINENGTIIAISASKHDNNTGAAEGYVR